MRSTPFRTPLACVSLAVLLALGTPPAVAQNAATRASQFYEDALQRYDRKDYAGAVVQLKNVLRLDARNLSAQVLLGKALLADGELNAADVALNEALRLGASRAEVVVSLANANIRQGRPDVVLSDARFALDGLPRDTAYELLLQRAAAALDLAEFAQALKAVEDARALRPQDAGSYRSEVPARIRLRQLKEALAAADKAVALAPDEAESHFVRAEALHVVPDLVRAQAAYDRTLALDPRHVGALVARAGVHLDLNRVDAALADVTAALKESPREPRATYLKALVAERQGRAAEARATLGELTALIDPIPAQFLRYRPQTQMLGGLAHHALGNREKAKPYLEGVLRSQPGSPVAKVLADLHLADRNADAAIAVLDAYLRAQPGDTQATLLLANAHLGQGRAPRAVQLLQEALKRGERAELRPPLALALVGAGRLAEGLRELEAVHAKDPRNFAVASTLAALHVRSGQAGPALRVAQALDRHHPQNPTALTLLAQARGLGGDLAGARGALEAALKKDPGHTPARVELARLEMASGNLDKAAPLLDAVLAQNDKHPEALAAMADLSERYGRIDQAERWLARADEVAVGGNTHPALALVELHLRHGQVAKAQDALKRAQAKAPDAVTTLIAAGRVALAAGDAAAARSVLGRAATAAGFSAPQLTQVAALQVQAGAGPAAAHSLDKALSGRPDHLPALALRAEVDIRAGDFQAADARVKRILALAPRAGLGHALAGDLASARRQPDAALVAYRRAHELDNTGDSLMRLFVATQRRDPGAAQRLASQWLAANPRDATVWRALGDSQFGSGRLAEARKAYEAIDRLGVRDADALNNLAHVLIRQQDPGALKVAERALAMAPGAAHVIGTAGWAAFKAGQNDRALQLLRDARLRDPANADTRYFLAGVLAAMGRGSEARTELSAALAPDSGLTLRDDAQQLLASLR